MNSFHKLRNFHLLLSARPNISLFLRFFGTQVPVDFAVAGNLCDAAKKTHLAKQEAQAALFDYLHSTRNLKPADAEMMSKNAPEFVDRLLQRAKIDNDVRVGRSLARFLRYHPINEFEPFFESIGLKSSEYTSFLPCNLIFLEDDQCLLRNYYVLCGYGFARSTIGKMFKEARELFLLDSEILQSKLRSFETLGLKQSLVIMIIASSPYLYLLKGSSIEEFLQPLAELKSMGIEFDWIVGHMQEGDFYNWKFIFENLCLLGKLGLSEQNLRDVVAQHPDLLQEYSVPILLGLLLKFGFTQSGVQTVFLQFPGISVLQFVNNLCRCYKFFVATCMPVEDIGWMFRTYPVLLGSCKVKEYDTLRCKLNCGRKRIREMIKNDPYVVKKWVLGRRVERLPEWKGVSKIKVIRMKFLLSLGFVEKSKEMEKALTMMRAKAVELQERFECLVNAGLSRDDVIAMLKVYPAIICQSKDSIEAKIGCFVKDLGCPLSELVTSPRLLSYGVERMKLRHLMYGWLKDEGVVNPKISSTSLLKISEEAFIKDYINSHPRGPEFWEKLKEELYSD